MHAEVQEPMNIPPFLEKLLSKATVAEAARLILAQPLATTQEEGAANHQKVVEGVYTFVETLDDKVALIPYAGPILAAIVDSPAVDAAERKWVEFVVELGYQSLNAVGATKVTDPIDVSKWKPGPEPGTPLTDNDFQPNSGPTGGAQ